MSSAAGATGVCYRVTVYLFHSSPPFGCCFGANQRPAAHPHQRRSLPAFREVVEVRAANAVPAAELRDGKGKRVGERELNGTVP